MKCIVQDGGGGGGGCKYHVRVVCNQIVMCTPFLPYRSCSAVDVLESVKHFDIVTFAVRC